MKFYVKFVVATAIAAVALAGRGETENVPDVLTAIWTRKSMRKFDAIPLGYPAKIHTERW